ncbi:MAG: ArsR/SmtB family transcription factor [Gammaproteobacteria bacterium]
MLRIMGHPDRIRIVEELADQEQNVSTLLSKVQLPGPRVSQHLRILRAYRIVDERRVGQHRIYHLLQPQLVNWITRGLDVVENHISIDPGIHIDTALS